VALARALLRDPAILLLDEPTSALDPTTEAEFNLTLRRAAAGRTVISVTHRLQSVVDADRIFVLEHGRLVQQGTHAELVQETAGVYASLWASQSGFSVSVGDQGLRAEVSPQRLAQVPLFGELSAEALGRLARQFAPEEIAADRVVIRQGDMGDRFYLVARGTLEVTQTDAEGVLNVLEDGDYFGEIALLQRAPRTATVRARTPCILLSLTSQHFEQLLAEESSVREAIERVASERGRAGTPQS
jgi:ATP-binding cassette subfamily B protein